MDLFEYQGKQLFARHGLAVPSGEVADTPEQAKAAAEGRAVEFAELVGVANG